MLGFPPEVSPPSPATYYPPASVPSASGGSPAYAASPSATAAERPPCWLPPLGETRPPTGAETHQSERSEGIKIKTSWLLRPSYPHASTPRGPDGQWECVHGVKRGLIAWAGQVRWAGTQGLIQLRIHTQSLPGASQREQEVPLYVLLHLYVKTDTERVPKSPRLHPRRLRANVTNHFTTCTSV